MVSLDQFKQTFLTECAELLVEMEGRLVDLTPANADSEKLNAIFRCAHSIKGGAGAFGLTYITNFTHVLEALLDLMREGKLQPTHEAVDALLKSVDVVTRMVEAAERTLCVNTERRFVSGYSGGSFMAHVLACTHGDSLRGVATIAGGQGGRSCTGNVAALLIHDLNDSTVNISASEGARDNHAMRNGCNLTAARTPTMDPPCEAFTGCNPGLPVVWCQTSGRNHDRQDALAAPIFWNFFAGL